MVYMEKRYHSTQNAWGQFSLEVIIRNKEKQWQKMPHL